MAPAFDARTLRQLVVKDGVRLGVLPQAQQALVLGWVWAALVDSGSAGWNERGINDALRAELASSACFLDIDHVELRRWLVDAGWLQRDDWGRQYRRTPLHRLPAEAEALASDLLHLLGGQAAPAWTAAQRQAHAAARAARRQRWQQGDGASDANVAHSAGAAAPQQP